MQRKCSALLELKKTEKKSDRLKLGRGERCRPRRMLQAVPSGKTRESTPEWPASPAAASYAFVASRRLTSELQALIIEARDMSFDP